MQVRLAFLERWCDAELFGPAKLLRCQHAHLMRTSDQHMAIV